MIDNTMHRTMQLQPSDLTIKLGDSLFDIRDELFRNMLDGTRFRIHYSVRTKAPASKLEVELAAKHRFFEFVRLCLANFG